MFAQNENEYSTNFSKTIVPSKSCKLIIRQSAEKDIF